MNAIVMKFHMCITLSIGMGINFFIFTQPYRVWFDVPAIIDVTACSSSLAQSNTTKKSIVRGCAHLHLV